MSLISDKAAAGAERSRCVALGYAAPMCSPTARSDNLRVRTAQGRRADSCTSRGASRELMHRMAQELVQELMASPSRNANQRNATQRNTTQRVQQYGAAGATMRHRPAVRRHTRRQRQRGERRVGATSEHQHSAAEHQHRVERSRQVHQCAPHRQRRRTSGSRNSRATRAIIAADMLLALATRTRTRPEHRAINSRADSIRVTE